MMLIRSYYQCSDLVVNKPPEKTFISLAVVTCPALLAYIFVLYATRNGFNFVNFFTRTPNFELGG